MGGSPPYAHRLDSLVATMHEAVVRGSRARYWVYGDQASELTLVMVHGFRGDHHGLEPLAAHLPRYRVIVPDLPGFGASDPFSVPGHALSDYVEWLTEFRRQLAPDGSVIMLGHSFGSLLVSAAVSGGLATQKMILINPIGTSALHGPHPRLSRMVTVYYRLAGALPDAAGLALLRNRIVVRSMSTLLVKSTDPRLRAWIHDQHSRYFTTFSRRDVVLETFSASVGHGVRDVAPTIQIPTLLISGDRDDLTSVADQQRLAGSFPRAELTMLAGVGHLIHYEAPARAAAEIAAFVDRPAP